MVTSITPICSSAWYPAPLMVGGDPAQQAVTRIASRENGPSQAGRWTPADVVHRPTSFQVKVLPVRNQEIPGSRCCRRWVLTRHHPAPPAPGRQICRYQAGVPVTRGQRSARPSVGSSTAPVGVQVGRTAQSANFAATPDNARLPQTQESLPKSSAFTTTKMLSLQSPFRGVFNSITNYPVTATNSTPF